MKKTIALFTAGAFALITAFNCMAAEGTIDIFSVEAGEQFPDRPQAEVVKNEVYVSDALVGASALYYSGGEHTLDNIFAYGAGTQTEDDMSAERASQYGYCSAVLANGEGTKVTLNNPTIKTDPESNANGIFATAMAKIYVNGGTIDTNNALGHGLDATYLAHIYADGVTINTAGRSSGSIATDYGGGFITGKNMNCTTEVGGSPAIYCAGSSIIMLEDSVLTSKGCEAVMNAHDHGVVVLKNCTLYGEPCVLNGHQALPSPAMSTGSYCFIFGGTLEAGSGPIISESNGRTETTIVDAVCNNNGYENVIEATDDAGILTVNLWGTELIGNVYCGEGAELTINIYDGAKLAGDVSGNGTTVINVYPGGVYEGSFEAVNVDEAAEKPEAGDFDYYLVNYWATGMQRWDASTISTYIDEVQPIIAENSAYAHIEEGTAEIPFDENIDISENGVDPSLLDLSSANGIVGAGGESGGESAGEPSGESEGEPGGESAEEPAE